jgi:RNA polymerase sigma-70 factor (ECF subfamily)
LCLADDPQDGEDIVTASLLEVWRMADRFHGSLKASVWIFGIVYRSWLDHQRRQEVTQKEGPRGSEGVLDGSDPMGGDSGGEGFDEVLRRLAPEARVVFELTYRDGYHYTEIAEILGCSEDTVKARMAVARRLLDRCPL